MTQVSRSIELQVSAEQVWDVIGGFQSLADWHPVPQQSIREDVDGVEHRRLELGGDAPAIVEKHLGSDAMSYGYEITDPGPLPVSGYRSILSVSPTSAGCCVSWVSTFTPVGDEAGAAAAVAGVYDAGLGALQERFAV